MNTTITNLPLAGNDLTNNDYLLVDVFNGATYDSKKIVKSRILGYKAYHALLNQESDNPPTAIVFQNELNDEITFVRDDKGVYSLMTTENTFTNNKTFVLVGHANTTISPSIDVNFGVVLENETQIRLTTISSSSLEDGCLQNTAIEIRVYN
jgi:hypothetical protein